MADVVVIGATGALGSDCVAAFAADGVVGLGHNDLDITDPAAIDATLDRCSPRIVVNTAAFHNVPKCSQEGGLTGFRQPERQETRGIRHSSPTLQKAPGPPEARTGQKLCLASAPLIAVSLELLCGVPLQPNA